MPTIRCMADDCRWQTGTICVAASVELTFRGGENPECVSFDSTQPMPNGEEQAVALLQEAQAALPDQWLAKPEAIKDLVRRIDTFIQGNK